MTKGAENLREMRVTHLALEWPGHGRHSGGVGRYIKRLTEALADSVQQTVIVLGDPEPSDVVTAHIVTSSGNRFRRYYLEPISAAKAVSATRPDVIHVHGDGWALPRAVPTIRTFYGTALAEARASRGLRRYSHYVLAGLEAFEAQRSTVSVGIGPESSRHFRCQHTVPPTVGVYGAAPVEGSAKAFSVVFIGTFAGRKRGWAAVEAVSDLQRRGWPLGLTVFGPKADEYRYPDWVEFRSGADDGTVQRTVASSLALLVPSLYEGFGIPMYEAMLSGTPVVGTRTVGSDYLIGDRSATLSALIGHDIPEFQEKLRLLIEGKLDLRVAVADGLERARLMQKAGSADRYLSLYRDLIASQRKGSDRPL